MFFKETAALVLLVMLSAFALIPVAASADTLTADFIAHDSFTHGFAPFTAQFEDRSTAEFSRVWSFGDGQTSTESNPSHTYTNPGSYTVSITVYDSTGTQSNTKTIADYIVVAEDPMHAATTTTPVPGATTYSPTSTTTTVPSTTATPAMSGAIEVTSLPTGAMVTLDNVQQGITPITLYTVAVGQHTVIVHDKGYVDNVTSVMVEYQKTLQMNIILASSGAKPSLSSTPPQSPVATITAAPTAEGQKAAVYQTTAPLVKKGTGAIKFLCDNCAFPKHFVYLNGKGYNISNVNQGINFPDLEPGNYLITIVDTQMTCQQEPYKVVLSPGEKVTVKGHACTPGFTTLLAVLAIAGIIGLRRCKK
jgi:hypothetical protein